MEAGHTHSATDHPRFLPVSNKRVLFRQKRVNAMHFIIVSSADISSMLVSLCY